MSKYSLSKQIKNELASPQKELPQIVKQGALVCEKATAIFAKTTQLTAKATQAVIDWTVQKLADIDYEKLFIEFLKGLTESQPVNDSNNYTYTYYETVTYTTTRYKRTSPSKPSKTGDGGEINLIEEKQQKRIPHKENKKLSHKKNKKISAKPRPNISYEQILMIEKKGG